MQSTNTEAENTRRPRLWRLWSGIAVLLVTCGITDLSAFAANRSKSAIAEFKRLQPCPANGNRYGPCPGWQIDHVVPLKCAGPDEPANMQWLTVEDHKAKTKREARLCRQAR